MVSFSQRRVALFGGLLYVVSAASSLPAQSSDHPMTRMRPIGSPSAVDQYRPRSQPTNGRLHETAYQNAVRQTAMLQQAPPLPANPTVMPVPATQPGVALPANPIPSQSVIASDVQPMPKPQLGNQFATIDNCNLVSPASGHSAAFQHDGCGNVIVPQAYAAPQPTAAMPLTYSPPAAEVAVPVVIPAEPRTNARTGAPMRSVVTFGQERNAVQLGQGLVGQPVAYVPGQPLRNWLRYFMP